MDLCQAMRKIVSETGRSQRELARDMGRRDAYISATMSNVCSGKDIGVGKLVLIADACGYDVVLVNRGSGEGMTIG